MTGVNLMLREADARRLAAELDNYQDVRAVARLDAGPYLVISVTFPDVTWEDGRPFHFLIYDRRHGESCARVQRERHQLLSAD